MRISPLVITSGGELPSARDAADVEAAFGCLVTQSYAASEAGGRWRCPSGTVGSTNSDWFLTEPIDGGGDRGPGG